MAKKKTDENTAEEPQAAQKNAFAKQAPIKVSFSLYIISIAVVTITVFILMLVQYLPGYRQNKKLENTVKNADYVYVGIRISKEELKERDINPLTMEDDLMEMLRSMGVEKTKIEINPDKTDLPGE
ncbi:MAG: hypothetical protein JW738_09320 [Actinobacteria bacterium]|nr:hypothetical protein [Actinomycetota bacterium]